MTLIEYIFTTALLFSSVFFALAVWNAYVRDKLVKSLREALDKLRLFKGPQQ